MHALKLLLIEVALVYTEDYSSYYNDVNYEIEGDQIQENETVLEEIISFGNQTVDLSDLVTYQVTKNSNLPDLSPVRYLFSLGVRTDY